MIQTTMNPQNLNSLTNGLNIDLNYSMVNNLAICDLYLGNVPAMLMLLSKVMSEYPSSAGVDESLVYNYCSGVELGCSGNWQKSLKIQKTVDVSQWAGDGFDTAMLKL
ncbi:hypothetical protein AYI70_g5725 [Smittium culicis]|uniref:Uncharacterized protein n=1 Tax=Smittium culicis TaxID=133412 RepID=A0A1R1XHR5_9FUNG|nr:hypothetical protein AYI70_g8071 [Smittium culicis]OMJ17824.1 hypothetical protein AYI70_g5725 [Smittium culicis]